MELLERELRAHRAREGETDSAGSRGRETHSNKKEINCLTLVRKLISVMRMEKGEFGRTGRKRQRFACKDA
jgi:hypothetical protein